MYVEVNHNNTHVYLCKLNIYLGMCAKTYFLRRCGNKITLFSIRHVDKSLCFLHSIRGLQKFKLKVVHRYTSHLAYLLCQSQTHIFSMLCQSSCMEL